MLNCRSTYFVFACVLFLGGCAYIPFAGGELEGTVTPVPNNWSNLAAVDIIQIETNPSQPYSVKLWVTVMDNIPYIHAGENLATWVENLQLDPELRLENEGKIYELKAERVTSADEFKRLGEIYHTKHGNYPRNPNIQEVYLYRLLPR
jgi:hypothetical protein